MKIRVPRTASRDEKEALARALVRVWQEWGWSTKPDLKSLIVRWAGVVGSLEEGYRCCVSDYELDLALRDELDAVMAAVPERLSLSIRRVLEPLESRFFELTVESSEPLLPPDDKFGAGPRWRRLPLIVRPDPGDSSWKDVPRGSGAWMGHD